MRKQVKRNYEESSDGIEWKLESDQAEYVEEVPKPEQPKKKRKDEDSVAKKKKDKWIGLKPKVYTIPDIISIMPLPIAGEWNKAVLSKLKKPVDYFKYLCGGPVLDSIALETNNRLYGVVNTQAFTTSDLYKYIGILFLFRCHIYT